MSAYRELFRLSIAHAYHGGRFLPDCRIVPAGATRALMERCGLVMRQLPDALVFLMPAARLDVLRSDIADAGGAFSFLLCVHAGDPLLASCTAPSTPPGMLLVADSRRAVRDGDGDGAGAWRLHPDEQLGAESLAADADPLCAAVLAEASSPRRPFLLVHLALSNDAGGFPGAAGEPAARAYTVHLAAGASYWKYYLLGALAPRELAVADLDGAVAFRRTVEERLASRPAAVFLSERAIGLRERPGERFQLLENTPFGEKILMKRMPVASPGIRQTAEIDGRAVLVSEIFINY
jgi:hypothetical protein